MKGLPYLINDFSNLILAIEDDKNFDPYWQRFYQIQMATYILNNQARQFLLEEAIDVYKRINNAWEEVKVQMDNCEIPVKNIDNIFSSKHIEFPNDCRYLVIREKN